MQLVAAFGQCEVTVFVQKISFAGLVMLGFLLVRCATTQSPIEQSPSVVAQKMEKKDAVPITSAQLFDIIRKTNSKVIAVNLWSTFCAPCVEEIPALISTSSVMEANGLRLLFVSLDFDQHWADAALLLAKLGHDGVAYVNAEGDVEFGDGIGPQWTGLLPTTLIYDRNAHLLEAVEGKLSGEQFKNLVERHLPK